MHAPVPRQLPLLVGGLGRLRLRGRRPVQPARRPGLFPWSSTTNARGGFEPLRYVPKGKKVVLGLVTSKRPDLESKDLIKRRLEEASRFVPLDQICLSPQCGFSSTVDGNALTWAEQEAKLRLVVEIAEEVWGS
ncbi:MAG: hypothetical protein WDM92_01840 [Caulobacteraceae bacterium]